MQSGDFQVGKYQLFDPLANLEYEALRADIAERGVLVPIEVDEEGNILDGHHRFEIAQGLGRECPHVVREFVTEEEKRAHVYLMNLARRHLSPEQLVEMSERLEKDIPAAKALAVRLRREGKTLPEIAAALGKSVGTAFNWVSTIFSSESSLHDQRIKVPAEMRSDIVRRVSEGEPIARVAADCRISRQHVYSICEAEARKVGKEETPELPPGIYDLVLADPPWRYDDCEPTRAVENHYPTMALDDICNLSSGERHISEVCADDCVLFLWATSPTLPDALRVVDEWGFEYKTCAVWHKLGAPGMGYYFRQDHEFLILGTRGQPEKPATDSRPSSVFSSKKGRHSEKPAEVYGIIERMYPNATKLELFCRNPREGWTAWGNEAGDGRE